MMITRLFAAVLAMSSTVTAAAAPKKPQNPMLLGCKSEPPSQFVAEAQAMAKQEEAMVEIAGANQSWITVNTYIHVVAATKDVAGGYVPQTSAAQQITALNTAYAPWNIRFVLKGVDYTVNQTWSDDLDTDTMKAALRKGSYADLNLYYQRTIQGGTASGYCYFPMAGPPARGSQWFNTDGCQIQALSMPGGAPAGYYPMKGMISVHEVGHWFGLFHTFQGNSCDGPNDTIGDTPAEAGPSYACAPKTKTCPNRKGFDPVNNYMDYSGEGCWTQFTKGQGKRMRNNWAKYRKGK